jgi:hypothetical protein
MRLYSYVVARDFGFAPNPFYGTCTLATCKADIRRTARIGDWIVGTGSRKRGLEGQMVYAMRVTEDLSYDEYWREERFRLKRPTLDGSLKQAFGDNIYRHNSTGDWQQANSHHSLNDGTTNPENVRADTRADRVLISDDFLYWGGCGPPVPASFRNYNGMDICVGRQGHRCRFDADLVRDFVGWLSEFKERGYLGGPEAWADGRAIRRYRSG